MHSPNILLVCCLLLVSNVWFYLRVLRPVSRLARQAQALEQGNLGALETSCGGIAEIDGLRRAMASMAQHVRRAQVQQAAYAERLAESREDERKRIAHELHDTTVQSLVAVAQALDLARSWLKTQPERVNQALDLAREQAVGAVAELRELISDLRPPALEELGLGPALETLAAKSTAPRAALTVTGTPRRLDETAELALFRAAQEALSNATRHGGAKNAQVSLEYAPEAVVLKVADDGRGFEMPHRVDDLALGGHYGLIGMKERVTNAGGTVAIDSAPHRGTIVTITLPARVVTYDEARDPVCGAVIEPGRAYKQTIYRERVYTFCCPVCQGAFEADPERYSASA